MDAGAYLREGGMGWGWGCKRNEGNHQGGSGKGTDVWQESLLWFCGGNGTAGSADLWLLVGRISADPGGHRGCPWLSGTWPQGDKGRWRVSQSGEPSKGGGWGFGALYSFICIWKWAASKLFNVSRNWLTLRGPVPPEPTRPQVSQHQNTENERHG